jgi:drug/metabolite transporter (DMT)-like permease
MSWNNSCLILLLSVFVATISQILLKKSALEPHASWMREYMNGKVIGAYLLLFLSTILTIIAFRGISYKNGIMIDSTGYLFILAYSYFFLKEKISRRKWIGSALIITGLIIYYL